MSKVGVGKGIINKNLSAVLGAHDIQAIKANKYALQNAAFQEGYNHDGDLGRGGLRKLALQRVIDGDTNGGKVEFNSHAKLYNISSKSQGELHAQNIEQNEKNAKGKVQNIEEKSGWGR